MEIGANQSRLGVSIVKVLLAGLCFMVLVLIAVELAWIGDMLHVIGNHLLAK